MSTLAHFVDFLDRLEAVRELPNGEYQARCPAHEDRSPSLSIALGEDDRILIYCFAGCSIDRICRSINFEMSNLFPRKPVDHRYSKVSAQLRGATLLRSLAHEILIIEMYARAVRNQVELSERDHERMTLAIERIAEANNRIGASMHDR